MIFLKLHFASGQGRKIGFAATQATAEASLHQVEESNKARTSQNCSARLCSPVLNNERELLSQVTNLP